MKGLPGLGRAGPLQRVKTQSFERLLEDLDSPEVNGQLLMKCFGERWWAAPSCRGNHSNCVAVLTSGRRVVFFEWNAMERKVKGVVFVANPLFFEVN